MNLPPIKSTPPPPSTALRGECSECGIKDRWLLHRVLLRGTDRRLCTSCVLRVHPSSFCPSCLDFLEHPLSASAQRFMSCVKCSSLTHLRCLPSPPPPPSSFLCPQCSTPNFSFFPNNPNANHVLDQKLALVFLCAAKIASASAVKALAVARARADRTVREAAAARKRAKEALERVDKVKRVEGSIEVSASRDFGTSQKVQVQVQVHHSLMCKKEDFNGQNKTKVSPLPQNGVSVPVNNNGGPHSVVRGNGNAIVKDNTGNDEDLERVKSCHGRIVDVN